MYQESKSSLIDHLKAHLLQNVNLNVMAFISGAWGDNINEIIKDKTLKKSKSCTLRGLNCVGSVMKGTNYLIKKENTYIKATTHCSYEKKNIFQNSSKRPTHGSYKYIFLFNKKVYSCRVLCPLTLHTNGLLWITCTNILCFWSKFSRNITGLVSA